MLLDHNGNPVSLKKRKWIEWKSRIGGLISSKSAWVLGALGTIAVVLANLSSILDFYERVTDGPELLIPVEISNAKGEVVEITRLLDLHITSTPFHSGRLVAGEFPSRRLMLSSSDEGEAYKILPGETKHYKIAIPERPYKETLSRGGSKIVFVLHIEGSDWLYSLEQPFHRDVLNSIRLSYNIEKQNANNQVNKDAPR